MRGAGRWARVVGARRACDGEASSSELWVGWGHLQGSEEETLSSNLKDEVEAENSPVS